MIRLATIADLRRLEPLAREFYAASKHLGKFDIECFAQFWGGCVQNGIGVVFLLEEAGEIVGTIGGVAYPDPYSGEAVATEFFWYVRDGHRGGGMRLYRAFEDWARAKNCTQIRMVHLTDSMPEKLRAVYIKLGYTAIETHYGKPLYARAA